ncbi:putative threonine export protein [Microlunatus phosphovorus NM-1]|uniref:Putative threonine export protein n=1 Tax=Microlunatus phosphovorus (strain ATCC 700054 / DSM 10555 / JCM 9379 / NBRC 101784 / NCIMB 13414 / VKM Ac-1990 / NM-1) TaxID=1032480 RepID=F5XH12_MICPN|nr:threonine/serine exporter family protein [Microlunatus phosphovorus]BAK35644.1 putative threonine export protein [Microlunatus phosphovorus NM-1]
MSKSSPDPDGLILPVKALRDLAASAVRNTDPETLTFALPGQDDQVSQRHARTAIDLALRVGEALLVMGASAADVTASTLRLLTAYGVTSAHVDITFTSITVSVHRGLNEDPLTVLRVIRQRGMDHSRLQNVQQLVDRVTRAPAERRPSVDQAREELVGVLRAPQPYHDWVGVMGGSLLAVGIVISLGGSLATMVLAAISAAVVAGAAGALGRAGFPTFFVQVISAAIPTLLALGVAWLQSQGMADWVDTPSLVVVSGIVVLLAGMTVVGAAQDALDGYYVTASARGLEVVVVTMGIAVGIGLILTVASLAGLPLTISTQVTTFTAVGFSALAALLAGVGFSLSARASPRTVLVAAVVTPVVYLAYLPIMLLELPVGFAVAGPAVLAGVLGYVAQRLLRVPEQAVTTAAIVMLLPGLAVFRGVDSLISLGVGGTGLADLLSAVGTGLGLAAGASVGGFVARKVAGLDRVSRRVFQGRQRTDRVE